MDSNFAIDAILTKAFHENYVDLTKLQVEENGRSMASLQGHIAGYKELIKIISDEFLVSPGWCSVVQDNAEHDVVLPDMSDEEIAELNADAMNLIKNSEAWGKVISRIQDVTNTLKNRLFTDGHSTRDLDLAQGHYHGMTIYEAFFKSIDDEVERRKKAKKEKEEQLPFDDEGFPKEADSTHDTLPIVAPMDKEQELENSEKAEEEVEFTL